MPSLGCEYGCGEVVVTMHEAAPVHEGASGVGWLEIGRYCAKCGAYEISAYDAQRSLHGRLGRRLKGATNLFDVLGNPKTELPEQERKRLETEEAELEAHVNDVRLRLHAIREAAGELTGLPYRPQLVASKET